LPVDRNFQTRFVFHSKKDLIFPQRKMENQGEDWGGFKGE
jgi:hypothetical protein